MKSADTPSPGDFMRRALASRDAAWADGSHVAAEAVLAELDERLAQAKGGLRSVGSGSPRKQQRRTP